MEIEYNRRNGGKSKSLKLESIKMNDDLPQVELLA